MRQISGRFWFAGVVLAGSLACVGGSMSISQRFAAIHNAVGPIGFAQVGPVSEGDLGQGESTEVPLPLSGGKCYLIAAIGGGGVWDIDASLADSDGNAMAEDRVRSPQASIHFCAPSSGTYELTVTMRSGAGNFAVFAWTAAGEGVGFGGGGIGGGGCSDPLSLSLEGTVRGSTQGADDSVNPDCIGYDSQAPDRVYEIEVETRGTFTATLSSEYDGALVLMSECGYGGSIACNDDAADGDYRHSRVRAILEPGTYFLAVDGYGNEAGGFSLETSFQPMRPIGEVCAEIPTLVAGQVTTGSTAGQGDNFQTSADCANGSNAPDTAYRLVIERPSRVRIRVDEEYDGVVAIRRDCESMSSVVACNDDFGEGMEARRVSQVVTRLEPGSYTVIVDGYEGEEGSFRILATVAPEGEGGAPADSCENAGTLAPGDEVEVDTFLASDDLRGSCVAEPGGADAVYRIEVPSRSLFTATARGDLRDAVLYVQESCGDRESELLCGSGTVGGILDPGSYFLVLDGSRRDSIGTALVEYELSDAGPLEAVCSDAQILEAGAEVSGRTAGTDRFQAGCGDGARNAETIYSLRIRERSSVNLRVSADFDSVLYVRSECIDPGAEVGCNDDAEDQAHSELDLTLDPGTYYVFVDGYGTGGENGSFTLEATVRPTR